MTNLKKSYSVPALAILALTFCVLLLGQAVIAGQKSSRLNEAIVMQPDDGIGTVPLPTGDIRGQRAGTSASAPTLPESITAAGPVDPDATEEYTARLNPYAFAESLGKELKRRKVDVAPSVRVTPDAALAGGDTPATATAFSALPYMDTGDFTGAIGTSDADLDCGFGDPAANGDLWWAYTPTVNGFIDVTLCNSPNPYVDFLMGIWDGDPGAGGVLINCDEDACVAPSYGASEILTTWVFAGYTYYIQVKHWGPGGLYQLDVTASAFTAVVEPETCGNHNTDGCYPAAPNNIYTNSVELGALTPGDYAFTGETFVNALPRTFGPGGTADADQWRFTVAQSSLVTWEFQAEVQMGHFLHTYPTIPGTCATQGLVAGTNLSVPAYVVLELQRVLSPGVTYTFSLRGADEIMTCTGNPFGGAPRYYLKMNVVEMTPIDDCGLATAINSPATQGTVETYYQDLTGFTTDGPAIPGYGGWGYEQNAWWRIHTLSTGIYTVSTCNTATCEVEVEPGVFETATPDLVLGVFADGCPPGEGTEQGFSDDDCGAGNWQSETTFIGVAGNYYLITVGVFPWSDCPDPTVQLDVSWMPLIATNDDCADAIDLGSGLIYPGAFVHNIGATMDGPDSNFCDPLFQTCADVWYTWTATSAGTAAFDMCYFGSSLETGWDSKIHVYRGSSCSAITGDPIHIGCSDDGCGNFSAGGLVEVDCAAGETFLIRIAGWWDPTSYASCLAAGGEGFGYLVIVQDEHIGGTFRSPNFICDNAVPVPLTPGTLATETGTMEFSSWGSCPLLYNTDYMQFAWNVYNAFEIDVCANVTVDFCGTPDNTTGKLRNYWGSWSSGLGVNAFTGCLCSGDFVAVKPATYVTGSPAACDASYAPNGENNVKWIYNGLIPGVYYVEVSAWTTGALDGGTPTTYWQSGPYTINYLATAVECVYCDAANNPAYCPPGAEALWMSDFTFADVFKNGDDGPGAPPATTPNDCNSYEDHTDMVAHVYKGLTYNMTVRMRKLTSPRHLMTLADSCTVFIDWNQNSGLAANQNELSERYSLPGTLSPVYFDRGVAITIPMDAMGPLEGATGETLIRVRISDSTAGAARACGIQPNGEVEDFVVAVADLECGDFDMSGGLPDAADIAFLRAFYFGLGPAPDIWQRGDIDGDGAITIADLIALADAAYRGGALNCI